MADLPPPCTVDEDGDPRCEARRCDRKADHALVLGDGSAAYRCQWHAELLAGERRGAIERIAALHRDAVAVPLGVPSAGARTASVVVVVLAVVIALGFLALVPVLL